ncbi:MULTISPECIES: hypothetical protein [unclassified Leptolyngbya]|uniref:hypothetical protein n=1 Tax=unclassified Leptolyngbya TaxID=2650499 RepID=UPI00168881DC|nr:MULTISPECIES: hypothetical protein [unclassified Leptolyngbya]MBD1911456.1 hypothetical protein [Leptolyngbya sp. FACHB-8]MBD2153468.1 hypothetical protein [Leptolyngbya sp. FACHB-16]
MFVCDLGDRSSYTAGIEVGKLAQHEAASQVSFYLPCPISMEFGVGTFANRFSVQNPGGARQRLMIY